MAFALPPLPPPLKHPVASGYSPRPHGSARSTGSCPPIPESRVQSPVPPSPAGRPTRGRWIGTGRGRQIRACGVPSGSSGAAKHSLAAEDLNEDEDWATRWGHTRERELLKRAHAERAAEEQRRKEVEEQRARQLEAEARQEHAEARARRIQALIAMKTARREAAVQKFQQQAAAQRIAWEHAVVCKKEEERERRAMEEEERATRAELERRGRVVKELEERQRHILKLQAQEQDRLAAEAACMANEDHLAREIHRAEREALERKWMAAADEESKLAAQHARDLEWMDYVARNKDQLRQEQRARQREAAAMTREDAASSRWRLCLLKRRKAEQARAAVAAVDAAIAASKALAAAQAAAKAAWRRRATELEERALCQSRMQAEDIMSRSREKADAKAQADRSWAEQVALRKEEERRRRFAQDMESAHMLREDRLSRAMQAEEQRVEAQRLEQRRALEARAAEAARALEQARADAARHQAEQLAAAREPKRLEEAQRLSAELACMAAADRHGRLRRVREAEECRALEQRLREMREGEAMAREDKLSRRAADARRRQELDFEREYRQKMQQQKKCTVDQRELRRMQEEAERESQERLRQQEAQRLERMAELQRQAEASARQEAKRRADEAAAKTARQVQEEAKRCQAILDNEMREFEERLKQNRRLVAECRAAAAGAGEDRSHTGKPQPPPLQSDDPCAW